MYTNLYKRSKKDDEMVGNRLKCIYLPFIRKCPVNLFYFGLKKNYDTRIALNCAEDRFKRDIKNTLYDIIAGSA